MLDGANIAIRLGLYSALLPLFGLALFGFYGLAGSDRRGPAARMLRLGFVSFAVAASGLSVLGLVVTTAMMSGARLDGIAVADVSAMLVGMAAGQAWMARAAALTIVLAAALALPRWPNLMLIVTVVASGCALATLAWAGHGAADIGSLFALHVAADIVHLLAAGAWLGGISGLCAMVFCRQPNIRLAHRALVRFAAVGTTSVAALCLSGILNSWILIGFDDLSPLWMTLYGRLLSTKLGLFAGMLVLAGTNRFRLTPALGAALGHDGESIAVNSLRLSLALEACAALAIIALVAWLGTLAPPAGS